MTTNPFIEQSVQLRGEQLILVKYAHKFTVEGIYYWNKPIKEEIFDPMRKFCAETHIDFLIRQFDSDALKEDREEVVALPAYQIYLLDEYETTLYPGIDCVQQFRTLILKQEGPSRKRPEPWFSWSLKMPTIYHKKARMLTSFGSVN